MAHFPLDLHLSRGCLYDFFKKVIQNNHGMTHKNICPKTVTDIQSISFLVGAFLFSHTETDF